LIHGRRGAVQGTTRRLPAGRIFGKGVNESSFQRVRGDVPIEFVAAFPTRRAIVVERVSLVFLPMD
jgi:hypothetical protein